jgi:hypothetical protein
LSTNAQNIKNQLSAPLLTKGFPTIPNKTTSVSHDGPAMHKLFTYSTYLTKGTYLSILSTHFKVLYVDGQKLQTYFGFMKVWVNLGKDNLQRRDEMFLEAIVLYYESQQ